MANNELTTQAKTVSMMSAQRNYIDSISKGLTDIIGNADNYSKVCGYNILNQINLALAKDGLNHLSKQVDKESINNGIKFAMIYSLNTDNKEVFAIVRNEKRQDANGTPYYVKVVEVKPQYKGTLKIVSEYGRDIERIYPEWIVREGDDFTYQSYKGIEIVPPTWTPKSYDGKVLRVIVPIKRKDGYVDFRIAERESVATNIKAQVKQAVMFKADKEKIMTLINDMTLDELLSCKEIKDYVNDTYTGISQEEMIITKLVLNAVKRVAIDYKNAFAREIMEKTFDNADVYKKNHNAQEIIEQEQTLIEMQDCSVEEITQEKPKAVEHQPTPSVEVASVKEQPKQETLGDCPELQDLFK